MQGLPQDLVGVKRKRLWACTYTNKYKRMLKKKKGHTCTNLWMYWLTSSWEGIDNKLLSSLSMITLWAQPNAVAGSSQTLLPTLHFPFERVVGGVKAVTFKDGVGEDGAINMDGRIAVSLFSSPSFLFFESTARLDKDSFFKPLMWTYFSLSYLVAISANQKLSKQSDIVEMRLTKTKVF